MDARESTGGIPRRTASSLVDVLSAVLLVLGVLLTPIAGAAASIRPILTDPAAFVALYGPLSDEPAVQAFIAGRMADAIDAEFEIPFVSTAIRTGIRSFVASDRFGTVWNDGLELAHRTTVAALRDEEGASVSLRDGEIGLELEPLVARLREYLVSRSVPLAGLIPAVDGTVVIAELPSAIDAGAVYGAVVASGIWMPVCCVVLLAGGTALRPRRTSGLVIASASIVVFCATTIGVVHVVTGGVAAALGSAGIPHAVTSLLADRMGRPVDAVLAPIAATAALLGLVAVVTGRYAPVRRARSAFARLWEPRRR